MIKIGEHLYSDEVKRKLNTGKRSAIEQMISERTGVEYRDVFIFLDKVVKIKEWTKIYEGLEELELDFIVEQIILDYTFST